MSSKLPNTILKHIDILQQELARLKKDIIHSLSGTKKQWEKKPSLFGSVKGGDITEEMIEESKGSLFRNLTDL
jgi:hypothetical protein